MPPSAALQSRIRVFEALEAENVAQKIKGSSQYSPLKVAQKSPEYGHGPHILDSGSTSPTADSLSAIPPILPTSSRSSSPIALGRKSSLIDFSELTSPSLNPISANGTGSTTSSSSASDSSRKLQPPQLPPRVNPRLPPLPPRKPSNISLKIKPVENLPPLPKRHAAPLISSATSQPSIVTPSLRPSDLHTYPPTPPIMPKPGFQGRHVPSSSTSSFHSVSLSSDYSGETQGSPEIRSSLEDSFEAVSSSNITNPTSHEWEHDLFSTSKVVQPAWRSEKSLPLIDDPPPFSHRPAPPPPLRATRSVESTSASQPIHPPLSIPPNARKRYNALFERNLPRNPSKPRATGWRGVSVDLVTVGEKDDVSEERNMETLDGDIVKRIWSCSRLPRVRLKQIWNECDPERQGTLSRDAFAKGMWRIDEELSRGENRSRPSPFQAITISYAPRAPPRAPPPPLRKPNFLVR